MPHNFDYLTAHSQLEPGLDTTRSLVDALTMGPDADERWHVKRILWSLQSDLPVSQGDLESWDVGAWLATGETEFLTGDEVGNTGLNISEDHRVLDAAVGHGFSAVLDDTNANGAGAAPFRYREYLEFDRGDVTIEFPGELTVGTAHDTTGMTTDSPQTNVQVSVHYVPASRH